MVRLDDRCAGRVVVAVTFVMVACVTMASAALAQTTPQSPSSAQPVLPQQKPGSPIVESLVGPPPLEVRKPAHAALSHPHVRHRRQARRLPIHLDRPALAGVELLAPLPRPGQPPHIAVSTPAYVLDELSTPFLTPAPPVVCHDARREPGLPDLQLYREVTVACVPDNP